jgi:hypothetical protein
VMAFTVARRTREDRCGCARRQPGTDHHGHLPPAASYKWVWACWQGSRLSPWRQCCSLHRRSRRGRREGLTPRARDAAGVCRLDVWRLHARVRCANAPALNIEPTDAYARNNDSRRGGLRPAFC